MKQVINNRKISYPHIDTLELIIKVERSFINSRNQNSHLKVLIELTTEIYQMFEIILVKI